jgi:hypothetical protein
VQQKMGKRRRKKTMKKTMRKRRKKATMGKKTMMRKKQQPSWVYGLFISACLRFLTQFRNKQN